MFVCLPLLLGENASWLWYLLTAIFEWCLLTVTARSKASDRGRSLCGSNCACMLETLQQRLYNVIQRESGCWLEPRGPYRYSHLVDNSVSACVCEYECGLAINSALKSRWHFSPSNDQNKQYIATINLMTFHSCQRRKLCLGLVTVIIILTWVLLLDVVWDVLALMSADFILTV